MQYIVKDALGKMVDRTYLMPYHAACAARTLNLNEATHYSLYYGVNRFSVVPAQL